MSAPFPYLIRPMTILDIPDVLSIERMVFQYPWPEAVYFKELYARSNSHYFVLRLRPQLLLTSPLLGLVGLRLHQQQAHLSALAVHPRWQRKGLGEWLLLTALQQAVSDLCHEVVLEVRVDNAAAQSLYAKYGFRITSLLRQYYRGGGDAYLMRVVLSPFYVTFLRQQWETWRERWYPHALSHRVGFQNDTFSIQEAVWMNENEN